MTTTAIDWKSLTDRDAKDKANETERAALRQPEHLDTWKAHLSMAIAVIDRQIASNDFSMERLEQRLADGQISLDDYEDRSRSYSSWRRRALFSKAKYVERIQEAKMLIGERNRTPEWQRQSVGVLRRAIADHRRAVLDMADDVQPSEADQTLWAILDRDDL
mgnify:FL=1